MFSKKAKKIDKIDLTLCKGQLISKWFLVSSISSKKTNERILLYYYDTSSRIVFVHFLEEIDGTQNHFEIN